MNDEANLLQGIIDRPDNDGMRLIYADWLEEHGQFPRADFIRVQIELATLDEYDPRRDELESRETELLARHQTEWLGPLCNLFREWEFRRGFLDRVFVDAHDLLRKAKPDLRSVPVRCVEVENAVECEEEMAHWEFLRGVSELVLADPERLDLESLLPSWPRLTRLKLSNKTLDTPSILALLRHGRALTHLTLENCSLGIAAIESLSRSELVGHLVALNLDGNELSNACIEALCDTLKSSRLARLGLARNHISEAGARAVSRLKLPHLIDFDLQSNALGNAGIEALARSSTLVNLRRLCLHHTRLAGRAVVALAESSSLSKLEALDLSSNNVGVEGARALARSANFQGLRDLDLTGNEIGDEGALALGTSPHLGTLQKLRLGANGLRVAGVKGLVASGKLPQLRSLDLHSNRLEDMGAQVLARSPHLGFLRSLQLHVNKIGAVGVKELATFRNLSALQELNLANNEINDEAVIALFGSALARQLTRLNLAGNDVSPASCPALKRLLAESPRLLVALNATDISQKDAQSLRAEMGARIVV